MINEIKAYFTGNSASPILNGDHVAFELENSNVPKEQRPDFPFCSFDAMDWAKCFCVIRPIIDVETMVGWFSNALMRGHDEASKRDATPIIMHLLEVIDRLSSSSEAVIQYNREEARDRYGDAKKAENWACVKKLREVQAQPYTELLKELRDDRKDRNL